MRARAGTLLALALLGLTAAPSARAGTWSVTTLHDDTVHGSLFGASCPSPSLCVVGGSDSLLATSTDPAGGGAAWQVFHLGKQPLPEEAPDGGEIFYPGSQIRGISCPSATLCVGATLDGRIVSSTDPTGGGPAWKAIPLSEGGPNVHMTGISCPSSDFCVVVAYGSKILSSHEPTGDAAAWQLTKLESPLDFRGVSCPTTAFCAAVDNEGTIAVSTDPGGPASAWQVVGRPGGTASLNGISCPSPSLCVTANAGQVITSTDPSGGPGAWHAVSAGSGLPVKGVSCPSASACAAVDNNSDAIVSTEPTGSAWTFTNVIPAPLSAQGSGQNGMFAIACPTTSLCLGAGASEQIITSTDPFAADPIAPTRKSRGPRVVIVGHPARRLAPRRHGNRVGFRFHAVGGRAVGFKCRLSGRGVRRLGRRPAGSRGRAAPGSRARFLDCDSPARYRVGKGPHVFRVRAIGRGGAKGPIASFHFRVGKLRERDPVGSCRPFAAAPPFPMHPCINARR